MARLLAALIARIIDGYDPALPWYLANRKPTR